MRGSVIVRVWHARVCVCVRLFVIVRACVSLFACVCVGACVRAFLSVTHETGLDVGLTTCAAARRRD